MKISEEGLRRRIGSDKLIGCYTQKDNGYTCFRDIRGEEGDMVKNPHTSQYDLEIEYNTQFGISKAYTFCMIIVQNVQTYQKQFRRQASLLSETYRLTR